MTIAIIQHDIRWGDIEENLNHLTMMLDKQSGADLYVLAETFATGFMAQEPPSSSLLPPPSSPLSWLQAQAKEKEAAFAASIATDHNRLFFVRPDGSYDYYDKRHLFGYAGETDAYAPGNRRVVVAWRGVRFLLQVCYDLRFPVWSRNRSAVDANTPLSSRQDYDAAIYVANWPASRIDVWHTLLKARALENQCFVIGVNRVGSDPNCHYCGGSVVIDAYGKTIAACPDNEESIAKASLDMERLTAFRKKFPVLQDADHFSL